MRDNWNTQKIIDIVDITVSNVDKKIYPEKKLVRLCNYMDVYSNDYITNSMSFSIGSASTSEFSKFSLLENDVIITKDSETPEDIAIPTVVIEDLDNVVCGYHLAILRPKIAEIDGPFLMHKLNLASVQKQFYRVASGSTRYGLTISAIQNVKVTIPPLPQQRKIARILSTCDTLIEKTEAAIAKYEAIKQGMMQDLFTRGIDLETGKLRPSYAEAPELYQETELGMVPKDWEVGKLRDISVINQGLQIAIQQRFKTYKSNRYVYITIQYLNDIENEINRYFIENPPSSVICSSDDILMVRTGNTGMVVTNIIGVFHNNFFKIEYQANIVKEFLVYYLNRHIIQTLIMNYAGTTTIPDLKHSDFYKIPFNMPLKKEQELIKKRLNSIDKKIQTEEATLSKYRQIKAGLMQDLLTGKVEVEV